MKLNFEFEEMTQVINVVFHLDDQSFQMNFDEITVIEPDAPEEYPWYDGSYVVMPKFTTQTLETARKTMRNNITVTAIRVAKAANEYGTTVYIGLEGD